MPAQSAADSRALKSILAFVLKALEHSVLALICTVVFVHRRYDFTVYVTENVHLLTFRKIGVYTGNVSLYDLKLDPEGKWL